MKMVKMTQNEVGVTTGLVLLNRGADLAAAGDQLGAIAAFRAALHLDAGNHQAWRNLGAALKGIAPAAERIACYQRALALADDPLTRANLAAALLDDGDFPAALRNAQVAVEALPDYIPALLNLGHARSFLGDQAGAEAAYRRILNIEPEHADALHALGTLLAAVQRYEEAAEIMRVAEGLRPGDHKIGAVALRARQQIADWSRFDEGVALLKSWVAQGRVGLPPFNLLSLPGVTAQEQLANAAVHVQAEFGAFLAAAPLVQTPRAPGPLRVGYLSADLRPHVMGRLLGPVLQHSAQRRHQVFVYDLWSGANPLKPSLEPHVTAWRNVCQMSVQETARLIADDGMDILVDLTGYTGHGRSAVLACRPAPVQASFLGYPGSLGDARLADYILTDRVTSPAELADNYAETLAWLPGSVLPPLCFDMGLPPVSRQALGLPETGVVLAAFHNGYKYNPVIFDAWMQILLALPGSVLWLLAPSVAMRDRFAVAAQTCGVSPARLVFYEGGAYAEYLAALALADLFLDSYPYTAGGTARDVLWCGVPMVTLLGETFAGRMAGSACQSEGVPECCTSSLAGYIERAVELGQDGALRRTLSERLIVRRASAPVRLAAYAKALDDLYERMEQHFRAGLAPALLEATDEMAAKGCNASVFTNTEATMKSFLHVGCGPKRKDQTTQGFNTDDWTELRLDIDQDVNPDIVGTMTDMSAVTGESVDAIFSSHNIEHLYPHEVTQALREFLRVLKPEGFIVITCPDLQAVCALVAEDKLTEPAYTSPAGPIAPLDILYGHRPAMARGNLYMAHRCGFTQKVLVGTLQASGFKMVASKARPANFDLWAIASKSARTEEEMRQLAGEHFPG